MTGEELIKEGQSLARPCVYLDDREQGEVMAVWGGTGVVPVPEGTYRHWISIDCQFLPQKPADLSGILSVYTDDEDMETGIMTVDPAASLLATPNGGLPLFGQSVLSLPPLDAVFMFGSSAVQEWLAGNKWLPEGEWGPDEAYNDNFPDRETASIYENAWMDQCPAYKKDGIYAVLGGWHMPWPEGDWYELVDKQLLVWTFKNAEPWIEAWADEKEPFAVIQRIT